MPIAVTLPLPRHKSGYNRGHDHGTAMTITMMVAMTVV